MADAALAAGAEVHGIIPEFLTRVERGHSGIDRLEVVADMRTRKARMLEEADAVVTLPGGCGTFEEFFEALTLKRLGQFLGPIILINTAAYYERMLDFLKLSVELHFMNPGHLELWHTVERPEQVLDAMAAAGEWSSDHALAQAAVRSST
jgi:hypothetical protein